MLFTVVSVALLLLAPRASGPGMFDPFVGTVRHFLPNLPWLVLGVIVTRMVAWVHSGLDNPADHFTHAIVAALVAGISTSLWYAAIVNASDEH
jgi:branched-subunit amino acid transport protein